MYEYVYGLSKAVCIFVHMRFMQCIKNCVLIPEKLRKS